MKEGTVSDGGRIKDLVRCVLVRRLTVNGRWGGVEREWGSRNWRWLPCP